MVSGRGGGRLAGSWPPLAAFGEGGREGDGLTGREGRRGWGRSRRRRQKTVSLLFLSSGGAAGRGERGSRN